MPDWSAVVAAMGKNFTEFMTRQQSVLAAQMPHAGAALPPPETARLAALQQQWLENQTRLWQTFVQRKPDEEPPAPVVQTDPADRRFRAPEWSRTPYFDYLRQAYLINSAFMRECVEAIPVSDGRTRGKLRYLSKQVIDAMSPANFAATNPEFIETALRTEGESIRRGLQNLLHDLQQGHISMSTPGAFEVGRNLAVTPGSVVFENELIQLIQYAPLTDKVFRKPLLIVPPCINKYYLMDLQPENSLVRYLVEQGHTVFLISWRNADASLAQHTWDDYLRLGPLTALDVVRDISGDVQPNALGFCVGGTLLASALAVACGRGEKPVASMALLTTLLDFSDAGEIGCLVDEAMVSAREQTIGRGGLMPGRELAQTFSTLRPNDLIWNYVVGNYLKGETPPAFDILHWNCDSTNLPGPFMAWYLRNLYLDNSLRIPGKLEMLGVKADLGKLDMPSYLLATSEDHIVPWTGAYLVRGLLGGETTFVLGASGHVAGTINPVSRDKRSYWTGGNESTAEEWRAGATEHPGSWWKHYAQWLVPLSGKKVAPPAAPGNARHKVIEPAPGRYVKKIATN
ncbi:class I poly(R)-hydroxyalkanoic acid synthase [Methyloversatilis thermotolerans]|uniref:class I poly(R)-hydroxyalkanoic acid synthase n=1 Tax=Methyloversatilis thermotolerans TaxID=1346290 RepID=UPI00039D3789|nr:class I poly(R)-hydroxyalkanoic acid synthase [Methyloversatilis thermotolerans]